jgi:hypothetical protein
MIDTDDVRGILTVVVLVIVGVPLISNLTALAISPTTENAAQLITTAAVNWWVPLAKYPLVLLIVFYMFKEVGAEELLEV